VKNKRETSRIDGYTLVEMLVGFSIVATLSAIAIPVGTKHIDNARIAAAIADIRVLEKEIIATKTATGEYPDSLSDIDKDDAKDPWGNPYQLSEA
jgi:prepilin-type N-terminal cleavage/methylation domain-containing protein